MDKRLQEIIKELNKMDIFGDNEGNHNRADNLLLEALRILGADDVATAWEEAKDRAEFWYA